MAEPNLSGHAHLTVLVDKTGVPIDNSNPLPSSASFGDLSVGTVGTATAAAPSYSEGQNDAPLSLDLAGNLRTVTAVTIGDIAIDQTTPGANGVDALNFPDTVDVNSGTKSNSTIRVVLATDQPALTNKLLVTPDLPSGASTAAKQPALGTAGSASADVITVQGVASMTPLAVQPAGSVAHDGVGTTVNPVLGGGYASAAAPSDVSADGDAVRAWHLRNGAAATVITSAGALIGGDAANGLDVDVTRLPALVAGTALIGKVGVDQTTPGTTNAVSIAQLGATTVDANSGNKSAGTLRVVLATDQPALTNALLVTASHGKTIKTASVNISADTDIIAAVTSKRIKVIAYALFKTGTNANPIIFKSNGTGGTELARVLLQSQASAVFGANLSIAAPSFLFATAAGEKLTMDVGDTDVITGFITYFDDDAT